MTRFDRRNVDIKNGSPLFMRAPAVFLSLGTLLYPPKGKAAYPPPIDKEYP